MNARGQHPMQPVVFDKYRVARFKKNAIVDHLITWGHEHGHGLNELATMDFSNEDFTQLAQLIGYSVSGAGDLSYFSRRVLAQADKNVEQLLARRSATRKERR